MSETTPTPETAITNYDMALEMAYAGKPFQDFAFEAGKTVLDGEVERGEVERGVVERLKTSAEKAEINAGREYLAGKRAELDEMSAQLEAGSNTETPDAESKKNDAWKHLSPEQTAKAEEEITRLAEVWDRDKTDFGLIESSFVDKEGNETAVFKVVLTSTKAIDLGDPEHRYDPKRNWDNTVETVKKFGLSGLTLQDARVLAKTNPKIDEWVWLTGQPELAGRGRGRGLAPIMSVYGGQTGDSQVAGTDDIVFIGFRPAVVIA